MTRFDLNSIFLLHSVLYRNYTEVISSSESPLHAVLMDLGNMPDQVTSRLYPILPRLHLGFIPA